MNIDGNTELIAHIGYPTHSFKSPLIYNPYFEKEGINALVVPMSCQAEHYPEFLKSVFNLTNIRGALITMPHKVTTLSLLDEVTPTVKVAGACNAVKRDDKGRLVGDMFDGGVGSAIAASLAAEKIAAISLFDINNTSCEALAQRLQSEYPQIKVSTGSNDPDGHDLVVNATPMGMNEGDPLPMDVLRIAPETFVGEVVMRLEMTAFLQAAKNRGCKVQVGSDMLFEQIPAYLEYFGLKTTTPDVLRQVARL